MNITKKIIIFLKFYSYNQQRLSVLRIATEKIFKKIQKVKLKKLRTVIYIRFLFFYIYVLTFFQTNSDQNVVSRQHLYGQEVTIMMMRMIVEKKMAYMLEVMTFGYLVYLKAFYWAHENPHMLESWMVQLKVIHLRRSRSLVYISLALLLSKSDNQYNY